MDIIIKLLALIRLNNTEWGRLPKWREYSASKSVN